MSKLEEVLARQRQALLDSRKAELSARFASNPEKSLSRNPDSRSLERSKATMGLSAAEASKISQRAAYDRVQKMNLQRAKTGQRQELFEMFSKEKEEAEKEKQRLLKRTQVAESDLRKQNIEEHESRMAYFDKIKSGALKDRDSALPFETKKALFRKEVLDKLKEERRFELRQKYHPSMQSQSTVGRIKFDGSGPAVEYSQLGSASSLLQSKKTEMVEKAKLIKLEDIKRKFELQKAAVAKEIQSEEAELKRYGYYDENNQLQLELKKKKKLEEIEKAQILAQQRANKEALLEVKQNFENNPGTVSLATMEALQQQQSFSSIKLPAQQGPSTLGTQRFSSAQLPPIRSPPQYSRNLDAMPYVSRYTPGAVRVMEVPPFPSNLQGGPVRVPKDYQFQIESFRSTRPTYFQ